MLAVVGFAGFGVGEPGQILAFVLSVVLVATATLGIGPVGAVAPAQPLLVLVAYALVTGAIAGRWFRWE